MSSRSNGVQTFTNPLGQGSRILRQCTIPQRHGRHSTNGMNDIIWPESTVDPTRNEHILQDMMNFNINAGEGRR